MGIDNQVYQLVQQSINILFCIGGDGTLSGAKAIADEIKQRVVDVFRTNNEEYSLSSSSSSSGDSHQHSAAKGLNESMHRALNRPLRKTASSEWEISIYEVQFSKRIGQGASATTYMASWKGQDVAVKVASITEFGLDGWRNEVAT